MESWSIEALAEWLARTGITVKIKNGAPSLSRPHVLHPERYEFLAGQFKERLGNRRDEFLAYYARTVAQWEGRECTAEPIGNTPGLGGVPHPFDIPPGCHPKQERRILIERCAIFAEVYLEVWATRVCWHSLYTYRTGYLRAGSRAVPDDASHIGVESDEGMMAPWQWLPWHTPPRKWHAPMDWVPRKDWNRPKNWVPPKQSKRHEYNPYRTEKEYYGSSSTMPD